jgi:hypothetical protein
MEFACRYNAAGIPAEHLDASSSDDEREAVFERSRLGRTLVICNCGILIEGVDLPWLSCCQILRGCQSLVLWHQAVGRIMRYVPGKEHGVVLDHAGAAHEYGVPDQEYHWQLGDERRNVKANKPPKDAWVTCPACGLVFRRRPACPDCGRAIPVRRRKSLSLAANGDGVLTEFDATQNGDIRRDALERLFRRCFHVARAQGKTMSAVAAMFSREAKCPPWEAGLSFHLPKVGQWRTPAKEWDLMGGD